MFNTLMLSVLLMFIDASGALSDSDKRSQFLIATSNFVSWNSEKDFGALIVTVLNDDALETTLKSKSNLRTAKGRRIEVKSFSWDRLAEINIIYVGNADEATLTRLQKAALEHKIIIISGYAMVGIPALRVFEQENKIRFDLDEKGFEATGIALSPALKRLSASQK
jgi:hypothetical protein